jgi:hypothetical protein
MWGFSMWRCGADVVQLEMMEMNSEDADDADEGLELHCSIFKLYRVSRYD